MHDWNFADPNTALMMMAKAEKKRKEREKEKEKNMTAAERYEKFKQQSKKKWRKETRLIDNTFEFVE